MNRRIPTFSLLMLFTVLLSAGFSRELNTVIYTGIALSVSAIIADLLKPLYCLKISATILSCFLLIYSLSFPHFSTLNEVYGLAISSDKFKSASADSIIILYSGVVSAIILGLSVRFLLIKRIHKKTNTGGS